MFRTLPRLRVASLFVAVLILVLPISLPAWAKRVALVVGNGAYQFVNPLKNPANDADAMASALQKAGFEVTLLKDLDQRAMKQALVDFGRQLKLGVDAGLFYYAGHGIEVNGKNYLVPVDSNTQREEEADIHNVDLNDYLAMMENSGVPFNILVLDACRNNPFRGFRKQGGGLAPVNAPIGTYVAYSTAPGAVAADGDGNNSPFTQALADELVIAGQSIETVFKNTRSKVRKVSDGKQVPFDSSAIEGDFFFVPKLAADVVVVPEDGKADEAAAPAAPVVATAEEPAAAVAEEPEAAVVPAPDAQPAEEQVAVVEPPPAIDGDATVAPLHPCDQMAGHPNNRDLPDGVVGVYFAHMIDVAQATAACDAARAVFPTERRFKVHASRLLEQQSQFGAAKALLEDAALMGSSYAQARIAEQFTDAREEGLAALERLAEAGEPLALNHLYWCHGTGDTGCTINDDLGLKWLQAGVAADVPEALHNMGEALQFGRHGLAVDTEQALAFYQKSATKGYPEAVQRLAYSYQFGELGLPVNPAVALRLHKQASDAGHAWASFSVGKIYREGLGDIAADPEKSAGYYQLAADRGDAFAHYALAIVTSTGEGVGQDSEKAAQLFLTAVERVRDAEFETLINDMKGRMGEAAAKLVQTALQSTGHYRGEIDGVLGDSSAVALQAYRASK